MNTEMNPQESLKIISEMIQKTQDNLRDNSKYFLLWGWLVLIASLSHYVLLAILQYDNHFLPWPILMTLGGIAAGVMGYRDGKSAVVRTHLDRSIAYVWVAFGVLLVFVLIMMPTLGYTKAYPMMMCLWAMGCFITGGILKFKPLIVGAIVCWALAVLAFFVSFEYQLLIMAAAITASYLIPGYLLKRA